MSTATGLGHRARGGRRRRWSGQPRRDLRRRRPDRRTGERLGGHPDDAALRAHRHRRRGRSRGVPLPRAEGWGARTTGRRRHAGPAARRNLVLSLPDLVALARRTGRNRDPHIRQKLAQLCTFTDLGVWNARRGKAEAAKGGGGSVATTGKLVQTRIMKLSSEITLDILGPDGMLARRRLRRWSLRPHVRVRPASSIYPRRHGRDPAEHRRGAIPRPPEGGPPGQGPRLRGGAAPSGSGADLRTDGHAGVAGHVRHHHPTEPVLGDVEPGPAAHHLLDRHPGLQPSQRRPQAAVDPEAEPQGVTGPSGDEEVVGPLEEALVRGSLTPSAAGPGRPP